jgi:ABC-type Fe3+/spermidine/putrescine transport system ATPase subunit
VPPKTAPGVAFRSIACSFGSVVALHEVTLDVAPGEFLALLGPSGSGKTTLLNIAAGFTPPTRGEVLIGGEPVTHLPPRRRNIGMIFQSYALFPHLTVFENVAYGLRVRRRSEREIAERVAAALAMVQLDGLAGRRIPELSGGQQQRVALARAIVIEPDLLLMDEPLGALDRQLRKHVQLEIRRLHRQIGGTTIYVTHDQEEALVMADRVGIMRAGRIEQIGTPQELYRSPRTTFVAGFLGESNLLRGTVVSCSGEIARLGVPELGLDIDGRCTAPLAAGQAAAALIRPEAVRLGPDGPLRGRVAEVVYLGEMFATRVTLASGQEMWSRAFASSPPPAEGQVTGVLYGPDDVLVIADDPIE